MTDVEFLRLGELDVKGRRREFDAVSFGMFYWRGLLRFEVWSPNEGRIYVISDRNDPLGDDYGMRPGSIEEVQDESLAKTAIANAIIECFDHTITREALPDGRGGWIVLDTDT